MTDEFYMQLALNEAWKYQGLTYPNPAVGAVVTHRGQIVAIAAHQQAGTSHAEVLALVAAYEAMTGNGIDFDRMDARAAHAFLLDLPRGFFTECAIYVTLEPCSHEGKTPSCASLLERLHLARVVIGARDPIVGHGGGADRLSDVTIGVFREACEALIEPFVIAQERSFILFKLAQTHNGRIGGGVISSEASRTHVHRLREVCSTLLIGGNTVRTDRPILDSRLSGGRAPDVVIYSHADTADRTIPLFGVEGREVEVHGDLSWLDAPGLVLVEGGEGMLRALGDRIDWMLTYQAPKLSQEPISYNVTTSLQTLHTQMIGGDIMIWSRYLGD
jgi:diaminohydroxyphosphoribosylaminopyrimidine deaminase/5-amino-6-(5-phosphoribosylamino)uracil reductase